MYSKVQQPWTKCHWFQFETMKCLILVAVWHNLIWVKKYLFSVPSSTQTPQRRLISSLQVQAATYGSFQARSCKQMQGKAGQGKANCIRKVDFMTFSLFHIALVVVFRIDSNHDAAGCDFQRFMPVMLIPITLRKSVKPLLICKPQYCKDKVSIISVCCNKENEMHCIYHIICQVSASFFASIT